MKVAIYYILAFVSLTVKIHFQTHFLHLELLSSSPFLSINRNRKFLSHSDEVFPLLMVNLALSEQFTMMYQPKDIE